MVDRDALRRDAAAGVARDDGGVQPDVPWSSSSGIPEGSPCSA
jgi:hypothetical protein